MTSGTRSRTRQAIVDAAIDVLGRNASASLGEIAAAAEVGRTTLHRYFPDRASLLAAVGEECLDRLTRAEQRARMTEGTGASAVHRLCQEYFDLGSVLSLLFSDAGVLSGPEWADLAECTPGFAAMVERGHRDGTVDPQLPAAWVQSIIWSQLYAGNTYVVGAATLPGTAVTRHEVLRLVLRTVDGAIAPRP